MESFFTDLFFFYLYRFIPVVLATTCIAGILSFCYKRVSNVDQDNVKDISLVNLVGKSLAFIFREGMLYSIVLIFVSFALYSIIFSWSIIVREGLPSEKEYLESLYNRDLQIVDPISTKTNLMGASHDEVDMIFGKADQKAGVYELYIGTTDLGTEYRVKVIFLPVINRVIWYESELFIG